MGSRNLKNAGTGQVERFKAKAKAGLYAK